ncbi:2-acyl-glycerophospho-ethanolamine acyltransferase, partial [Salmonella enterica subsp. enterica]|nr:2-acyl-glycerophospho-ethanolamine acyltransferase [Salmonella enterica subsp. enterica serovar Enteritidis]
MTQLVAIVLVLAIAGAAFAAWLMTTRNLSFHQALLYAPLKLLNRVNDRSIAQAQQAPAPVVYVIAHQSRFDPALMLSL